MKNVTDIYSNVMIIIIEPVMISVAEGVKQEHGSSRRLVTTDLEPETPAESYRRREEMDERHKTTGKGRS